jgi:hypothetical protein
MTICERAATFLLTGVLMIFFLAGCGTLPNGRGWGEDAIWPVDAGRVGRAARDALLDPGTLVPLAGAAVFAIDDFDERVSDWAVDHNPVFGSERGADDASNWIRNGLEIEAYGTPMLTPSGDTAEQWLPAKLRGYAVTIGTTEAVGGVMTLMKDQIDRERPDKSAMDSFPSGHSMRASSYATLSNRNLRYVEMPEPVRPVLRTANVLAAAGAGWARVEAGRHYPSDVLVGAALGHFLTAFLYDAFMNLPEDAPVDIAVFPVEGGAGIGLALWF